MVSWGPIPLSRSSPVPGLVHLRQRFVHRSHGNWSWRRFPHRRFNHAEQPNKLHPFIWPWTKGVGRATVVGHGVRQRTHDQSALSFIDHDPVFVINRHFLWAFSPSLDVCPGVPNSRWQWDVALPVCGQACAQSRPGGAGSGRGCWQRSLGTEKAPAV